MKKLIATLLIVLCSAYPAHAIPPISPSAGSGTDWTVDQGATDINAANIPDLSATYQTVAGAFTKTAADALYATIDHNHTGVFEPADANILKSTTTLGTFTGTTIDDGSTVKESLQALETAVEAAGGHVQNTDTGTSQTSFQIDSGNTGPRIKNESGTMSVRNAADDAYAILKVAGLDMAQGLTGGYMEIKEGSGGGTNYRRWSVPDALTASLDLRFPDAVPADNTVMVFSAPTAGVSTAAFSNAPALSAANMTSFPASVMPSTKIGTVTSTKYCTGDVSGNVQCTSDGTGAMTYPGAGIAVSTGAAWDISITAGTGVATAMGNNTNGTGGLITYGNAAGAAAVLTGWTSGAGTVAATDTILQGLQKVDGNVNSKSVTNAATILGTYSTPLTANPYSLTAANAYGFILRYNATGEIDLPAGAAGMNGCIYNHAANTITIDPNGSEVVVRDGTAQTGGVSFTLSSGAGNYVCVEYDGTAWSTLGFKGTLAQGS